MSPEPLPQSPGPKLAPFTPSANAEIQFIEELGDPTQDQDGRIWKISINGMQYALKMFKFIPTGYLKEVSLLGHRPLASAELYVDYFDPFNCECRAYGRLKEKSREDLAVRAHGYLLLTQDQEAEVTEKGNGFKFPPAGPEAKLNGRNSWGRFEEHRHLPIRAIVKDLLTTDAGYFTPSQVPALWTDLEDLHRLGILVRDIRVPNYMGGKLVDFSMSWTMPHPSLKYMKPVHQDLERGKDPQFLHRAIIELQYGEQWDEEVDAPEELVKCASGEGEPDRFGVDPSTYNWKGRNPRTADALMARKWFGKKRR